MRMKHKKSVFKKGILGAKVALVCGLLSSGSAFGLQAVSVAEIQSNLCPVDVWRSRQVDIMTSCHKSVGYIPPKPHEAMTYGYLAAPAGICHLPCDFQRFYGNAGY